MLRRLRHALLTFAATLGLVVGVHATPAQAVCNDTPSSCARIVHSVYSDVAKLSVSRVWPAQSGYIEALGRGTSGTYAAVYVPLCYQALVTLPSGYQFIRTIGWGSLWSGNGTYVYDLQYIC